MKAGPRRGRAVVISGCWPGIAGGYAIAVKAALEQYASVFEQVDFVGITDLDTPPQKEWRGSGVEFFTCPVANAPKWMRFIQSLGRNWPAVSKRYRSPKIEQTILRVIGDRANDRPTVVIYEGVAVSSHLSSIRRAFPGMPVAVRSHNVETVAFAGLRRHGSPLHRLAWSIEIPRLRRFEQNVCRTVDRTWAISRHDQRVYRDLFGLNCHGVIDSSLDGSRYAGMADEQGDVFSLIHVGSVDLRKSQGLRSFVNGDEGWAKIRKAVPRARFILGGRGTEAVGSKAGGVEGVGFVQDDREVLCRGRVFVNPQQVGSGIKLKSVVAMLAGRALVSTEVGVEGIEGTDGTHFLVAKTQSQLGDLVIELMQNPGLASEIGRQAREMASAYYSPEELGRRCRPLLEDFRDLARQLDHDCPPSPTAANRPAEIGRVTKSPESQTQAKRPLTP